MQLPPHPLMPATSPAPLVERVLDGLPSERSRQAYDRVLEDFLPIIGPTSLAKPLSANSMGLMLKQCLKNAGLAPIFRSHSFRVLVVTDRNRLIP